jgi:integrative and conjugative element protein (TIGR02256 family)
MSEIRLVSQDGRFRLRIDAHHVERILGFCAAAGAEETGGVLIGRYNARHDTALVTDVPPPPADSTLGRTWFHRGTQGLQTMLGRAWGLRREHYVGDWHFHPFAAPMPSQDDYNQMLRIASSQSWKCPEPILLIIGGDPRATWRAYGLVTTRTGKRIQLSQK